MNSPKANRKESSDVSDNAKKASSSKKYYGLDEIWEQHAKPDDILIRYDLGLKFTGKTLVAHMIVDPILDITRREVEFMLSEGFTELKQEHVKRSDINGKDKDLLIKSQFIDPEMLENKIKENLDKKTKK